MDHNFRDVCEVHPLFSQFYSPVSRLDSRPHRSLSDVLFERPSNASLNKSSIASCGGTEIARVGQDTNPREIQSVGIPASHHRDASFCVSIAVSGAGLRQALQLAIVEGQHFVGQAEREVCRSSTMPGIFIVILTSHVVQESRSTPLQRRLRRSLQQEVIHCGVLAPSGSRRESHANRDGILLEAHRAAAALFVCSSQCSLALTGPPLLPLAVLRRYANRKR
jgi:hypothetical protein